MCLKMNYIAQGIESIFYNYKQSIFNNYESFCCIPETYVILQIKHTSKKTFIPNKNTNLVFFLKNNQFTKFLM